MKIAYIYENLYYPGGIQRILSKKINFFCDETDIKTFLIYPGTKEDFKSFFPLSKNLNIIFLNIIDFKNNKKLYKKKLSEQLFYNNFDYTISIMYNPAYYLLGNIKDNSKKIVEFHTCYEYSRGFSNVKYDPIKAIKERFSFLRFLFYAKKYDYFVALTESDAKKWRKHLTNVVVIPNFIEKQSSISKKHSNDSVIAVGRFEGPKNFPLLIKTWAIVAEKNPNIKLKIFGSGPMQKDMETLINNLNLNHIIELIPTVSNIQDQYLNHKFLVSSSSFEGLPMVVLEAMSLGLPTVTLPMKGGMPDLVIDKETGLVAKSRNPKDFADTIVFALNNNSFLEELGRNSLVASKKFDKEIIMQKWIDLFNNNFNQKS